MVGCSGGGGGGSSRHWFRQRGGLGRLGDRLGGRNSRGPSLFGGRGNKEGFYLRKNNMIRITHAQQMYN